MTKRGNFRERVQVRQEQATERQAKRNERGAWRLALSAWRLWPGRLAYLRRGRDGIVVPLARAPSSRRFRLDRGAAGGHKYISSRGSVR